MRAHKLDTAIRREQIALAALELLGSQGSQDLSIAGVARKVGLVPSGIYRHFKSKDLLLEATLDLIAERLQENLRQVRQEQAGALARLESLLAREVQMVQEHHALPHVLLAEGILTDSPHRRRKAGRIMSDYFQGIERIVRQGQLAGELRRELDPLSVVLLFKGILLPAVLFNRLAPKGLDLPRHARKAWQMFRRTVAAPDPPGHNDPHHQANPTERNQP